MNRREKSLWLFAPRFVCGSEIWMYRQARGIQSLDVTVFTHVVENLELYPADTFHVQAIPRTPTSDFAYRLGRIRDYLLGYYPLRKETLDWFCQLQARPDIILGHYGTTGRWALPIAEKLNRPLALHFNGHDLSSSLIRNPAYRKWLVANHHRIAGFVVVARYMSEWLESIGVRGDKIQRIPYGTPMDELVPAENVGGVSCSFVAVGRLVDKKRPDLTIRAFARCHERMKNTQLTIIGDGPLDATCRQLVQELGISSAVRFLGRQPMSHVKKELSHASVFVQHSVTAENGDKEGWPVAIGEAAGCGLPIISTRHASIPEQVEHGESGLLVDEHDWVSMAAAMESLAANPKERLRMGTAARSSMMKMETKNQIHRLEEFLLQLADMNEGKG